MQLAWNANSESDIAGYNVYRSETSGNGYVRLNQELVSTNTYTDGAVPTGVTCFYVVTAVNSSGLESEFSAEVSALIPSNNPPLPTADAVSTFSGVAVTINLLSNDSDPDGDSLTVTALGQASNGTVVNQGDGSATYTSDAGFTGTDSFNYTVSDNNGGTASATVTVTVGLPTNSLPVASDDSAESNKDSAVTIDVLANDTDPDGDSLSIESYGSPSNGSVAVNGNSTLTYTPNPDFSGTDNFLYTVSDGRGGSDSATVTITVKSGEMADLSVSVSAPSASVQANENVTYTVTVVNNGPANALTAQVTATLPPGLSVVSAESSCTTAAGSLSCDLGRFGRLTTEMFTVSLSANEQGTHTATFEVSSDKEDPNTENNSATASVTIEGEDEGDAGITAHEVQPAIFSPNGDGVKDEANFQFTVTGSDTFSIEVLNRTGKVVAVPLSGENLGQGTHSFAWDGTHLGGRIVRDGRYTYRISGNKTASVTGEVGVNTTVPEISSSWFLAEGSTVGFDSFVLIQNPNEQDATVNLTFFRQDGSTRQIQRTVPAQSRETVPMHQEMADTFSISTQVDSDLPIIVERAMYMNQGQNGHDSIGVTSTSPEWYFPANRTQAGDENFILIANPEATDATVTARFYFEDEAPIEQTYAVGANSRFTIPVHGIVPGTQVSVELESSGPVAAERAFYFNNRRGGAAGTGAVSSSQTWYFAEGDTDSDTYLELLNPGELPATVTVNYLVNAAPETRTYLIPAQRRLTVDVADEIGAGVQFGTEIVSDEPVVAERVMFSTRDVGTSIGSPTPDYVWNLAEGFTAFGYETYVLIANPEKEAANVTVRFMQQNGENVVQNFVVGPQERLTLLANDWVNPTSLSTQVSSDQPIVVERTMKFSNRDGMHQAMGVRQ